MGRRDVQRVGAREDPTRVHKAQGSSCGLPSKLETHAKDDIAAATESSGHSCILSLTAVLPVIEMRIRWSAEMYCTYVFTRDAFVGI